MSELQASLGGRDECTQNYQGLWKMRSLKHPHRDAWGLQSGQQQGETIPGTQEGGLLGA